MPTGVDCGAPKRLAVVALKFRFGNSGGTGPLVAEGVGSPVAIGGLEEKIVLVPARMAVGWVARPAIEAGCGEAGAAGNSVAADAAASGS